MALRDPGPVLHPHVARLADAARTEEVCRALSGDGRAAAGGLWGSSAAFLLAAVARRLDVPVVWVVPSAEDAEAALDDLHLFLGHAEDGPDGCGHPGQPPGDPAVPPDGTTGRVRFFPAWETLPTDDEPISHRAFRERLLLLRDLADDTGRIRGVVAPLRAVLQPVPAPADLAGGRLTLARGSDATPPEELCRRLEACGCAPEVQVSHHGQFARRGGIVDLWPHAADHPLRVEYFGDEVDSLRPFDPETQRSLDDAPDQVTLHLVDAPDFFHPEPDGGPDGTVHTLLDWLPRDAVVAASEPDDLAGRTERFWRMFDPKVEYLTDPPDLERAAGDRPRLDLHALPLEGADAVPGRINLPFRSTQRFHGDARAVLGELRALAAGVAEVAVPCAAPGEADRLVELLEGLPAPGAADGRDPDAAPSADTPGRVLPVAGRMSRGFEAPFLEGGLAVVPNHEIFHRHQRPRVRAGRADTAPIDDFLALEEGDLVVHLAHGIGRFVSLRRVERDDTVREFLVLEFADGVQVMVPSSKVDLVQKYIGAGDRTPPLSKVGGRAWGRKKEEVAEALEDMAAEMIDTQAAREARRGIAYPEDTLWQKEFEAAFPYEDTPDQERVTEEIKRDMQSPRPADRLLCGDVGYGKTEVAMRAAFKAVQAGKQVAVLVPTTVLARQHGLTFAERMADYPVRVETLSRLRSAADTREVLAGVAAGTVDVVIGTHRLLSEDVSFRDLGLLIVDEEQRFGVDAKERLKRFRATVDVLTLSATPIPRTLHMSLLGIREISNLTTPPRDRMAIRTEVIPWEDHRIRDALLRELQRDGQAYFLHNRVQSIHNRATELRQLVPEARFGVAHGQMKPAELEEVLTDFIEHRLDVLVCTTIIESGVDIPTVNTLIVEDADHFGLSELHQLRGRVGRWKHKAWCLLLLPRDRPVGEEGEKRLRAIEEFSELGAGFRIAMRDLEIRGAGNLLGREQSGHIADVGYDLYCEMLEKAVRKARGEPVPETGTTLVDLPVDALLPEEFIPGKSVRLEIYRRVAKAAEPDVLDRLADELRDRFGDAPREVDNLLDLARVRTAANALGISSVAWGGGNVVLRAADPERLVQPMRPVMDRCSMVSDGVIHLRPPAGERVEHGADRGRDRRDAEAVLRELVDLLVPAARAASDPEPVAP